VARGIIEEGAIVKSHQKWTTQAVLDA
jgi:hypothetical protein